MVSSIVFKLVAFADYSNLNYTDENIGALKRVFSEERYAYSPLQELDLLGNSRQGIILNGKQGFPVIMIGSQSIELVRGAGKISGFDFDEMQEVREQLVGGLKTIYHEFDSIIQESNRMGWISEYAYFNIDDDTKHAFRQHFLKPLESYKNNSTAEFIAKYAGREERNIGSRNELLNVITTINRWFPGQGKGFAAQVDGYGIEIDVNTVAENKRNRFGMDLFDSFVAEADQIQRAIEKEVMNGCN